jgi:GGDEF domain-containing protein
MQQLRDIGQQLGSAEDAEGLRVGKARLADCMDAVRVEAERQSAEVRDGEIRDGITSLQSRAAAEAALVEACASETQVCAVVMQLARLAFYNRRYGREVGDRVLRFFAEFVRRSFESGTLYRWTGPSLVLLIPGAPDKVQGDVRRCLEPKLRCEVDAGSRHVMLPIEAVWSVFPMMVEPRLLINRIDAFSTS